MELVFISDTHTKHGNKYLNEKLKQILEDYPDAILIHSGDISYRGELFEVENFLNWFDSIGFRKKIFIPGNHDFIFEENPEIVESLLKEKYKSVTYLNDSGIEIDGIKFWGSPVTPRFFDWAFNRDEDIQNHWDLIPVDTNVLITHGPPYGILDSTIRTQESVGCKYLRDKLYDIHGLNVHVFGHIHEGYGLRRINYGNDGERIVNFINASHLNFKYEPVNPPIILTI